MMIGQGYSATRRPCWRKPFAMEPKTCVDNAFHPWYWVVFSVTLISEGVDVERWVSGEKKYKRTIFTNGIVIIIWMWHHKLAMAAPYRMVKSTKSTSHGKCEYECSCMISNDSLRQVLITGTIFIVMISNALQWCPMSIVQLCPILEDTLVCTKSWQVSW